MKLPYVLFFILSFLWASPALPVSSAPCAQQILIAEVAPPIEPSKPKPIEPKRKARKADFIDAFVWWIIAFMHGGLVATVVGFYFDILFTAVMTSLATSVGFVVVLAVVLALGGLIIWWAQRLGLELSPKIYGGFVLLMTAMLMFAFFWVGIGLGVLWVWIVGLGLFLAAAGGFLWLIDVLRADGDSEVYLIFLFALGLCLSIGGLAVSVFFGLTGYSFLCLGLIILFTIAFLFSIVSLA